MTARRLPAAMTAWRIGDPAGRYPIYSAEGARRIAGRWHAAGDEVIYCSQHYSTAMLERLVYANGQMPAGQHSIEIAIPAGISYEVIAGDDLPDGWRPDKLAARRAGHDWYVSGRSALLFVPSVVARPEQNILINTRHAEFPDLKPGLERRVNWDSRLFSG